MAEANLKVFRGEKDSGTFENYKVPIEEGMVVLDAIHYIQQNMDPTIAVRWNCKAAKCGSCSAEVNGKPQLLCKSRMDKFEPGEEITVQPIKTFPHVKDLVADVSWNYEVNKKIVPFTPQPGHNWVVYQEDIERVQEFRKCIECFLCQNVCHVLRDHNRKDGFYGPRFMVRLAGLEMHPVDSANRLKMVKEDAGVGFCNITKCCTEVCPEDIHITDNAIIPLKERVVDEFYDPIAKFFKSVFKAK
ncbi:MAG: succinate dehydrogenase/fumarate reductase iron-sulfur subunit [Candidatus Melainabacteria bacterium]|jgi:succinate dehydrogenase / fumarate reductase iron-sulfur subunit|nr:succinate dehydrogenase/fumarate reductase iron-sulfur subunit [Candidatus Melainabacteria bacterium]